MPTNIMLLDEDKISCPKCEETFKLKEGIAAHLIEKHEAEYDSQLERSKDDLSKQIRLQLERSLVKDKLEQIDELNRQLEDRDQDKMRLEQRIELEKKKAADAAVDSLKHESNELKESLARKEEQITSFRRQELELRKEKEQLETARAEYELEVSRKVDQERKQIKINLEEAFKMREAEFSKKLSDAAKANDAMKRKLEQGSQQLQGEILELELESQLEVDFPYDDIERVKTGTRGADILQTVRMRSGTECGKIVWESKRTENWSNNWISKLKTDIQSASGNIGVIVTTAFPSEETESMVMKDGIWLVKPLLVRSLAEALRTQLIEVQRQKVVSAGREEHIEAMYDYICSPQFVQRIKAVVDHQQVMTEELNKERNAMTRIWNKREKQIDGITNQMMSMAGEIQGLADDGMPLLNQISALED